MEYYSSYLKKPQDYLKTIDLENCEDMIAPFDTQNKLHVIKLCIKTGNKMRDYLFQCESEADLNSWVEDFATVCGFTSGLCGSHTHTHIDLHTYGIQCSLLS